MNDCTREGIVARSFKALFFKMRDRAFCVLRVSHQNNEHVGGEMKTKIPGFVVCSSGVTCSRIVKKEQTVSHDLP